MAFTLSILGFLMHLVVLFLEVQGASILGGDSANTGFIVLLNGYPAVLVISLALTLDALVMTFLKKPVFKKVGMAAGAASIVFALGFILYLEAGMNILHIGWLLSGILLLLGNLLVKRA